MKLHRFFVPIQSLYGRIVKINDPELAKQVGKVLRLKAGEEFMLLDGDGFEYVVRLIKAGAKDVQAEILKRQMNLNEPELKITVYQSIIKKDNFEWVLEKCTEVGASAFVPVLSERSEKKDLNFDRAGKILKEAAEQSGRGIVPPIAEVIEFKNAISKISMSDNPTIIFHPEGEPVKNWGTSKQLYALNIFIGPEGGFSEPEIEIVRNAIQRGAKISIVNLGPRILRSETAGVVAAGIMLNR